MARRLLGQEPPKTPPRRVPEKAPKNPPGSVQDRPGRKISRDPYIPPGGRGRRAPGPDFRPDLLVFGDLHLHERREFARPDPETGLNSRLVDGLGVFRQILRLAGRSGVKVLIDLGDTFELKDRVPNHVLVEYHRLLEAEKPDGLTFIKLLGNHDYSVATHPLLETMQRESSGIDFIYSTTDDFFSFPGNSGGCLAFISFQRDQAAFVDALKQWNTVVEQNPDLHWTIFFHQEINGALYDSGKAIEGLPKLDFRPDVTYVSGHLHNPQRVGPVQYAGSPYPFKFGESNDKFVWLMESATGRMEPVQLEYPRFLDFHYTNPIDSETVKGNYVRIVGELRKEEFGLAARMKHADRGKMIEDIERMGARGVSVQIVQAREERKKPRAESKGSDVRQAIRDLVREEADPKAFDHKSLVEIGLECWEGTS